MNWMPIGAAPLDGTYCDLWVKGPDGEQRRVADCSYVAGEWGNSRGPILWTITHYAKITPPQVLLDWPTQTGWYWIRDNDDDDNNESCHYCQIMPKNKDSNCRVILLGETLCYEDTAKYWKYLPAPIPSFEGG